MNPKVKNFFVIIASALRTIFAATFFFGNFPLFWGISYNFDLRYLLQLFLGCIHSGANKGVGEGGCSSGSFWRHIHHSCHLNDFLKHWSHLGEVILTFCMQMKTIICSYADENYCLFAKSFCADFHHPAMSFLLSDFFCVVLRHPVSFLNKKRALVWSVPLSWFKF